MDISFRHSRARWICALLFTFQFGVGFAFSQSDEAAPKSRLKYFQDGAKREEDANPQSEADQSSVGLPYSRVFKNTDDIDLFKETNIDAREARLGSAGLKTDGGILRGHLGLPFTGKALFRPEDAEIRISNFYIDIRSIGASMLYSDNANRTEFNRENGALLALRLDFAILAPLTERLKISAVGQIIYLPLQSRFSYAVFDPARNFIYDPFFHTQVTYDLDIGNWEIEILDDFNIVQMPYDLQLSYSYFGGDYQTPETEGRYSYRPTVSSGATLFEDRSPYGRYDPGLIRAQNKMGAKANRLLPTETRAEIGFFHSDFWYLSGEENLALPFVRASDTAYLSLNSERDNLRFKPFAHYIATKYDYYKSWGHVVKAGIKGPITRNIDLFGYIGEQWLGTPEEAQAIWEMRLRHQIGPYTSHSIQYLHDVTAPDVDVRDRWNYQLSQILGDGLTGDFYGGYGTFGDLDFTGTGSEEWRAGIRFTYKISPKTTVHIGTTYTQFEYQSGPARDSITWRSVAFASHHITPTFEVQVQYERMDRDSKRKGDSYYENFGMISLIKYF